VSSDLPVPLDHFQVIRADAGSFPAIQEQLAGLAASAAHLQERIAVIARQTRRTADLAVTCGEMSATAEVDPHHIAQIGDVAVALSGVADATAATAARAGEINTAAVRARRAHDMEYRGVYEAVQATTSRQAKPGFYRRR
jgi:hypothetical protein